MMRRETRKQDFRARRVIRGSAGVLTALLFATSLFAGGDAVPEPAPAPIQDDGVDEPASTAAGPWLGMGTIEYSHGDPTVDEQRFLELMNRARANPAAEGARIAADYGSGLIRSTVNFFLARGPDRTRAENRAEFESYPAQPPFAFNAALIRAARAHTDLMRREDVQTHQHLPSNEPSARQRMIDAGYVPGPTGESVYAFGQNVVQMHAAFAIDWGQALPTPSQLVRDPQLPADRPYPGHRLLLMNPTDDESRQYTEVGVGILDQPTGGTRTGPRLITIDFSRDAADDMRFVTGVCFDDRDDDGEYDAGEGIAGVRIDADGTEFFTISSSSGGYALPVPIDAGTIRVTASGPTTVVGDQEVVVQLGDENVKVDFNAAPLEPRPPCRSFTSASTGAVDGTSRDFVVPVTVADGELDEVGDVDVLAEIAHADRTELELDLVSPDGTVVPLLRDAPPGADLRGGFDRSLTPAGDLTALVGESLAGNWIVRVRDAAGGTAADVEGVALRVRSAWVRPLATRRNPLTTAKLVLKKSKKAGRDRVQLTGEIDPGGGTLLDGSGEFDGPARLRVLDAADDTVLLDADLVAGNSTIEGAKVKARIKADRRGTSRTSLSVNVARTDLPGVPERVVVELQLGDVLLRDEYPLTNGRFRAARDMSDLPSFRITKLTSREVGGERVTVVRGAFTPTDADLDTGRVDVLVGDFGLSRPATQLSVNGARRVLKGAGGLTKLMIDAERGVFVLKIRAPHDALLDGVVPVALRVGELFGETEVRPALGDGTLRY